MVSIISKHRYVLIGMLVGLALVYFLSQQVVSARLGDFKVEIERDLVATEQELIKLGNYLDKGGVNEMASNVMQDCSVDERTQFDAKLSRLDLGLTISELEDLDRLFGRCAPVSAIHRAVMTMQLRQEVQNFESLILQRKSLGDFQSYDEKLSKWKELLLAEEKISDLALALVSLQKEIIEALLSGVKIDSSEAENLKQRGQLQSDSMIKLIEGARSNREDLLEK